MWRGPQLLCSSSAIGQFVPCRFRPAAALANIIEGRCFGVGTRLLGAGDIEFKMGRNGDSPEKLDGRRWAPVRLIRQTSD